MINLPVLKTEMRRVKPRDLGKSLGFLGRSPHTRVLSAVSSLVLRTSVALCSVQALPHPVFPVMKLKHRPRLSSGWQQQLPLHGSRYRLLSLRSVMVEACSSQ